MLAYIIRRLLLIIPTLFGIMLINFAVIQTAPGGPVEQIIAQIQGNAVDATSRVTGGGSDLNQDSLGEQQRLGTDRIPPPSAFVATRSFLRKPGDSPNQGHGHHWYGNAASYFLVGDGLGTATIRLLKTGP